MGSNTGHKHPDHSFPDPPIPRLLRSVNEAADILSISRSQVYQLIRRNHLTPVHIGRSIRVRDDELRQIAQTGVANL